SCSQAQVNSETEASTADVVTKNAQALSLTDGSAQALDSERILSAHIDKPLGRSHRISGNQHAFQHAVWITLQYAAVHERAGIAFVGIADHKLLLADRLGYRAPLQSCGIARAATATETAFHHFINDLTGCHLSERLDERGITRGTDVVFYTFRIDHARVFQHDFLLPLEEWNVAGANEVFHRSAVQTVHDRRSIGSRHLLVQN